MITVLWLSMAMAWRKRDNESDSSQSNKRCRTTEAGDPLIEIDHRSQIDFKHHQELLKKYKLGDDKTNITFMVDNVEIPAHRPVIDILKAKRQLVREAIEKDKKLAQKENTEEATVFQLSGTTPRAFRKLLEYIYNGKVECDLSTSIELATTAYKLKFHPLVASLAQHLNHYHNQCLNLKTADDLYHIGKFSDNSELKKICAKYLDSNAYDLKNTYLKRDSHPSDPSNVLVYTFDKNRYCNYIHFLLPETIEVCFNVSISTDRTNWTVVLKNDEIWSKFWNWVYFEEKRIKFVRIAFTDQKNGQRFDVHDLQDTYFLVKRADTELEFDKSTGYLIPKHDVIKFPVRDTKYYFGEDSQNLFTYCMSKSNKADKEKNYYYHSIGDKWYLEFYLSQTCLISNFRMRLWDLDDGPIRTYDFKVEVKSDDEEEFTLIKEGNHKIFRNKSSSVTVSLNGRRAVRWIRITGIKGPDYDKEFAVIDFECPAQS